MSNSIDNILKQLLDSQEAQTKALEEKFATFASEGNTYTERMRKMEESLTEAMKKVLEMDSNIKEYHKNTGSKVEAMEAQYAKMFEKKDEDADRKEDEKKHEDSEPESIKKQEEEMEDDEKKKKKVKAEHLKEDDKKEDEDEATEKKAGKFPSKNKLIVDGPDAEEVCDSKEDEKEEKKEASNQLDGINKNQTVQAKPNQKRHKENPLGKPKNAEETLPEAQASTETIETLATSESPASVPAAVEAVIGNDLDSKIEEIVKKFASLSAAKPVAFDEELNSAKSAMALEVKAKDEAVSKYKALEEKFESLLSKVNTIEKSAKTIEQKAAQIVSNQGTEAVAISTDTVETPVAETESDIYKKFATLSGVEQRKFYLVNKAVIERQASAVLSGKRS